eukprot:TRINITY_DN24123_c0_g1_i1.p1 TRINITY_DN24123_c0_g1~~TRINITY_DN24123_c0_g1_i1.p1  ORF type:complete len:385 (-),score=87.18 TRINITY_DN24123_c0_g1_i1:356-1510(-)
MGQSLSQAGLCCQRDLNSELPSEAPRVQKKDAPVSPTQFTSAVSRTSKTPSPARTRTSTSSSSGLVSTSASAIASLPPSPPAEAAGVAAEDGGQAANVANEMEKMHILASTMLEEMSRLRKERTALQAHVGRLESENATLREEMEQQDIDVLERHYRQLEAHRARLREDQLRAEQVDGAGTSGYATPKSTPRSQRNSLGGCSARESAMCLEPRFSIGTPASFAARSPAQTPGDAQLAPLRIASVPTPKNLRASAWHSRMGSDAGLVRSPPESPSGGAVCIRQDAILEQRSDGISPIEEEATSLLRQLPSPCRTKIRRASNIVLSATKIEGSSICSSVVKRPGSLGGANTQRFLIGTPTPHSETQSAAERAAAEAAREVVAERFG